MFASHDCRGPPLEKQNMIRKVHGIAAAVCIAALTVTGPSMAQQPKRGAAQPSKQAARSGQPTPAERSPATEGDQPTDITQRGRQLINKVAFSKTQTARTIADYTAVIEACQQGLAAGVDRNTADYAAKLMAWAHNRRGEAMLKTIGPKTADDARTKVEQESLAEFEAAINLDDACWRAYHNRGISLAQMRDFDGAMKDFDKAIALNPNHADAYYNRGELKLGSHKYAEAIADYNQALKLNPNDAAAYTSRGHARWGAGQHQAAVDDYNRAMRIDPKNALALTNRGLAYSDQGMYDRAAVDFRKAIELDAKLGQAYQGAAWLMATCPDERFRDSKKAVEAASKALELDGWNDYRYIDTLAAAYASAGRYDDAKTTISEAIKHAPQDKAEVLAELNDRAALYEQQKPYRDSATVKLPAASARRQ
jgi:tetratricopeptide (TPR) repeat protein